MRKIILLILVASIFSLSGFAQTLVGINVSSAGWKRVATLGGSVGRGIHEVTILTSGGNYTPHMTTFKFFKGWSNYGGLYITNESTSAHWSDARITFDGTVAYLEVNFTKAITSNLAAFVHESSWGSISINAGVLPEGGGDIVCEAKVGKLNVDNKLFVNYDGKVGIETTSPSEKLEVNGGISITGKNSTGSTNNFYNLIQFKNSSHAAIVYNPGETNELMFGFHSNGNFYWGRGQQNNNGYSMHLSKDGDLKVYNSVGIGCTPGLDNYKLNVNGKIRATEIQVETGWADFVFEDDYNLMPLQELDSYIKENKHLPEIPTTKEVEENGISVGEMNAKLLQKVEELTLYIIQLEERVSELENKE